VQTPVVHRAPWVLPIALSPINDGGVAVQSGRITAVGRFNEIARNLPGVTVVDHPDSVLLPALVNAHPHLELSNLAHLSQQPPPATFTGWIENMLDARAKSGFTDEAVQEAARSSLVGQQHDGVIAIGDISNTGLTRNLSSDFLGKLLCFKEYLGLRTSGVESSLQSLQAEADQHLCSAHAPYSTHADLLRALKKRAILAGHVFPIHVAEPQAESDMMSRGRGEFVDFLGRRGFWDGSFQPTGIDNTGSVQYLHQLDILDNKTLCVHCIHVSEAEIELLIKDGSKVCLCPGSNRYLGVGKAPVDRYLQAGMLPSLGTDSLASNPKISMWREMQLLADDYPDVDPADILAMATTGGAAALGLDVEIGSLEPGKQATFLSVLLPDTVKNAADVYDFLVTTGSSMHPQWIIS
jgi:cytosine/adenosine deaminase-related metal-dependent hydrolase